MSEATSHGVSGYRRGCRCSACREAKADETRQRRHQRLYGQDGVFGPAVQRQIIRLVMRGASVMDAAAEAGVTHQRVYRAAQELPEFGRQLNEATG